MSQHNTPDTLPVQSLQTSVRIIEVLVSKNGGTVTEISKATNTAQSTVHDHLTTLHYLGYVIRDGVGYKISTHFLRLGEQSRQDMDLFNISQPELHKLADKTGEFASLVIEENGEGILLATERGQSAVPLEVYNGIRMPIHTTASCKAILAFLPEERIEELVDRNGLGRITPNTIIDKEELFDDLNLIQEQGYALGHEERVAGVRTIAAPIIDRLDRVRGSIAVWGPTNRISGKRFEEEIPQIVMESSNVVELQLNYNKNRMF